MGSLSSLIVTMGISLFMERLLVRSALLATIAQLVVKNTCQRFVSLQPTKTSRDRHHAKVVQAILTLSSDRQNAILALQATSVIALTEVRYPRSVLKASTLKLTQTRVLNATMALFASLERMKRTLPTPFVPLVSSAKIVDREPRYRRVLQEGTIKREVPAITQIVRTAMQATTVPLAPKSNLSALQVTTAKLSLHTQCSALLEHTIRLTTHSPLQTLIA